jgi:hypothetical protein
MSLINDALRRASQTDKNRPSRAPTPTGMEAVPETRSSRLTMFLGAAVVIALLLAGLLFWQWLKMRNNSHAAATEPNIFPPVTLQVAPSPSPAPAPKPAPVAPAPVVAAKPAPAPAPVVVAAPPPVATPKPAPAPVVVAAPVAPPVATTPSPAIWPTDLKVSAIFFSRTNPRVMINGSIYGVGDEVEGLNLKKVLTDRVIMEMGRQTKEYFLVGQ